MDFVSAMVTQNLYVVQPALPPSGYKQVSCLSDTLTMFVHSMLALQSDPVLIAVILIKLMGTSAKSVPVMVTGIPEAPATTDCASVLTLIGTDGIVVSTSQPSVGSLLVSNLLVSQLIAVQPCFAFGSSFQ